MSFAKLAEKVNGLVDIRGYLLYIYDSEKMEGRLYPLQRIKPVVRIRETAEQFSLENSPAFYIEGKPVYVVFKTYPVAIEFKTVKEDFYGMYCDKCCKMFTKIDESVKICEKCGEKLREIKFKPHIAEKGYSASEIDAKITSIYTSRIFAQSKVTPSVVLTFILGIIIAVLATYIVMNTIMQAKIDDIYNSVKVVSDVVESAKILGGFSYFRGYF